MLNNLNSIIIEGNLVRDPITKSTPGGHQVCSFSLASNRFFRSNDQTEKEEAVGRQGERAHLV